MSKAKFISIKYAISACVRLWDAITSGMFVILSILAKMKKAAKYLIGTHDFSCFCATGTDVKDRVRTIVDIEIKTGDEGLIEIKVESHGFLKYMVRNIIGTLVEVGRGKREPEEMKVIIESKNRNIAGATAPACGLFLKEVKY